MTLAIPAMEHALNFVYRFYPNWIIGGMHAVKISIIEEASKGQ